MSGIQWKNPGPAGAGRPPVSDWDSIVEELRSNPGEWALVAENVNSGTAATLQRKGAEVTRRSRGKGYARSMVDIYARWPESAA